LENVKQSRKKGCCWDLLLPAAAAEAGRHRLRRRRGNYHSFLSHRQAAPKQQPIYTPYTGPTLPSSMWLLLLLLLV